MKVYAVGYYNCSGAYHLVAVFSTKDKAKKLIEDARMPFYKDGVVYDYRSKGLFWEGFTLDEFENIKIKNNQVF